MRLRTKLIVFISFFCLLLVIMLTLMNRYNQKQYEEIFNTQIEGLANELTLVSQRYFQDKDKLRLSEQITKLKNKGSFARIDVIDRKGEVVNSSDEEQIGKTWNNPNNPEASFEEVLKNRSEFMTISTELGDKGQEGKVEKKFILPIFDGDNPVGAVEVAIYTDDMAGMLRSFHYRNLIVITVLLLFGILLMAFLARGYSNPIENMADAVRGRGAEDITPLPEPKNKNNEIGHLVLAFNRMVENIGRHRQLQQHVTRLERLSAMGELAAGVAHEVRNPLNSIGLALSHLRDEYSPDNPEKNSEFNELVGNIKNEVGRLEGLVSDFLKFARPGELKMENQDLRPVIEMNLQLLEKKFEKGGLQVTSTFADELPATGIDREHIQQALLNIFLNAIDVLPEGGKINVSLGPGENGMLVLRIEDNGPGMDPVTMRRIFDPFFTTKEEGTGLGLSITRGIIENHGGSIHVESKPSEGTAFVIMLPHV